MSNAIDLRVTRATNGWIVAVMRPGLGAAIPSADHTFVVSEDQNLHEIIAAAVTAARLNPGPDRTEMLNVPILNPTTVVTSNPYYSPQQELQNKWIAAANAAMKQGLGGGSGGA